MQAYAPRDGDAVGQWVALPPDASYERSGQRLPTLIFTVELELRA